jgi:hypothetical protein
LFFLSQRRFVGVAHNKNNLAASKDQTVRPTDANHIPVFGLFSYTAIKFHS